MSATMRIKWFPLGIGRGMLALSFGLMIFLLMTALIYFVTREWLTSVSFGVIISGGVLYLMSYEFVKRMPVHDQELTRLSGGDQELFSADWILILSIDLKEICVPVMPLRTMFATLNVQAQKIQAAINYFEPGGYRIGKNGSMCRFTDGEPDIPIICECVRATIKLDDIPQATTIARVLREDKPSGALEEGRNCVIIYTHAQGKYKKGGEPESNIMLRFGARDGKIIVESWM